MYEAERTPSQTRLRRRSSVPRLKPAMRLRRLYVSAAVIETSATVEAQSQICRKQKQGQERVRAGGGRGGEGRRTATAVFHCIGRSLSSIPS